MQLFSADAMVFSKKILNIFLTPKKWKNGPQKLLIIGQNPYISQSSPDHSPQHRIDFSYYEISGPEICSLICGLKVSRVFYTLPHHAGTILHQGMWRFVVPKFSTFFSHPEHPWRTFSLTHCLESYGHSKEQVDIREWKIATKTYFVAAIRKW